MCLPDEEGTLVPCTETVRCVEPRPGRIERFVRTILVAVALALVAAGCGGGDESAPPPAGEEGTAPAAPPSGEVTTTEDPEEALAVSTGGWETDFTRHTVPLDEFLSGGPGKDGIPAIDAPRFVSVSEASEFLEAREPVIEVAIDGQARAYPLQILIWHEIANDTLAGTPISVTFCPLCNTSIVFDRRLDGMTLDFGTTGNLRFSDLVMYDRQTETWWQQFTGEGVVGELAGKELEKIPSAVVAWESFAAEHPDGEVLSRETGFSRPYGQNPYSGYDDVDSPPFFPVANPDDDRLQPKERVVYVERGDEAVAVPFSFLQEERAVEVEVGGDKLEVEWREGVRSALGDSSIAEARDVGSAEVRLAETGERVPFDQPFWFAVASFRPDVRVVGESVARESAPAAEDDDPAGRTRVPGYVPTQS